MDKALNFAQFQRNCSSRSLVKNYCFVSSKRCTKKYCRLINRSSGLSREDMRQFRRIEKEPKEAKKK